MIKVIVSYPVIRTVLLCLVCSMITTQSTIAQKGKRGTSPDNCQLDEAKKWYEQGELEKVESIEACVDNPKSMSREKRIEGLQLITESYLYRDKIGAADKTFRKLLKVNPLYVADSTNPDISYDLIYLSRSFSRKPIISLYIGGGTNFSLVEQLENYGVDNTSGSANHESYLRNVVLGANANIGLIVPLIYNFEFVFDATFGYRTYAFADSLYLSANLNNPTSAGGDLAGRAGGPLLYSTLTFNENQFWIDVPLMLRYNITKFKGFLPYIYAGGAANFLIGANLSGIQRSTEEERVGRGAVIQAPTSPINLMEHSNMLDNDNSTIPAMRTVYNVSFIAGAGVKFRVGRDFLFVDFRYTRMFLNNVDVNNRYVNQDLMYRYGHVDNDYRMDNFALSIGYVKAFYKPRKKRTYNPIVINNKYNRWLEKERNYIKKETDEDLKRELNSALKEMERQKPSLIEDVQKGRAKGEKILTDKQKELEALKNKRVKVEVKYE